MQKKNFAIAPTVGCIKNLISYSKPAVKHWHAPPLYCERSICSAVCTLGDIHSPVWIAGIEEASWYLYTRYDFSYYKCPPSTDNEHPGWPHPQSTSAVLHSLNSGSLAWQQQHSQLCGKSSMNKREMDRLHPQQPLWPPVHQPFQIVAKPPLFIMATGLGV